MCPSDRISMPIRYLFRRLAIVVAAVQFLAPATSGAQRALTAADYDRAVRMLAPAATTIKVTLLEPAPVVAALACRRQLMRQSLDTRA
jgi:hypothetical protein